MLKRALIILFLVAFFVGNIASAESLLLPIQMNSLAQLNNTENFSYTPSNVDLKVPKQFIPHITPDPKMPGYTNRNITVYDFILKDSMDPTITELITEFQILPPIQFNFTINNSVYYGAKNAIKNLYLSPDLSPEQNYDITYPALVDDPNQNELYENLLYDLRSYRTQHHLDDNEYLELIVRFVQSIPNKDRNYSRFPIETLFEGNGVCEDKSFLLAGLLEREGYDVGLFRFANNDTALPGHMVVGVRSNGLWYPGTHYTLIETTMSLPIMTREYHYIGLVDLQGLNPNPVFIKIGNGSKEYTKSNEIQYINDSIYSCFSQLNREGMVNGVPQQSIENLASVCQFIDWAAPDRESVVIWLRQHSSPIRAPENISVFNSTEAKPFYKLLG